MGTLARIQNLNLQLRIAVTSHQYWNLLLQPQLI